MTGRTSGRVPATLVAAFAAAALGSLPAACSRSGRGASGPPPVPVRIGEVKRLDVPVELLAIGHVEARSTVSVKPLVGGQITEVAFREGDDVPAGALLFVIDPRPFEAALAEATANLARDQARLAQAEQTLKRYQELIAKEYITQEQFDQARADVLALRATTQGDEAAIETARLNLGYCRITAPIACRTGSLLVHPGNVVKANDDRTLVVLNQIQPIYVSFAIPERDFDEVNRRFNEGTLKVSATPQGGGLHEGTLSFLDNAVDATTGTITLKASFPNGDRALWPGQYVNVTLTLSTDAGATVAPAQAILAGQGGSYVYVLKSDQTVENRGVTVKRNWGPWAVLAQGLAPGERVVTDGQIRLAPGVKVTIKPEASNGGGTRPEKSS